jgi:hypothetical protein
MTTTCICGGRYRRCDLSFTGYLTIKGIRFPQYQDIDPFCNHWKCSGCGAFRHKKKRQPKKREVQA